MALLGDLIDVRTIASLGGNGTATFAHGLPASPDFVLVHPSATRASDASHYLLTPLWNATNVTIQNNGNTDSPSLRVVSVVAHSIIR